MKETDLCRSAAHSPSGAKTAVLIVNTGSPAAPTREALAQYLLEFLGDRRVVELSPIIWQPILRWIIIPRRAQQSADRYKTVWTEEGSPLMAISAQTARRCAGIRRVKQRLKLRPALLPHQPAHRLIREIKIGRASCRERVCLYV